MQQDIRRAEVERGNIPLKVRLMLWGGVAVVIALLYLVDIMSK